MSTPVTATTTNRVDLAQLTTEMGGARLSAVVTSQGATVTCYDASVTAQALQAAVNAHVAAPPPPSLQAQIDELILVVLGF